MTSFLFNFTFYYNKITDTDPNGWASNKLKSRKTGIEIDYAGSNQDPNSLALTAVWSVGILFLFYRIFAVQVLHQV